MNDNVLDVRTVRKSDKHPTIFAAYSALECGLVDFRRRIEAAQLAHKLERSIVNLRLGGGRLEIEQGFDVPAHGRNTTRGRA